MDTQTAIETLRARVTSALAALPQVAKPDLWIVFRDPKGNDGGTAASIAPGQETLVEVEVFMRGSLTRIISCTLNEACTEVRLCGSSFREIVAELVEGTSCLVFCLWYEVWVFPTEADATSWLEMCNEVNLVEDED